MAYHRIKFLSIIFLCIGIMSCEKEPLPILDEIIDDDTMEELERFSPKRLFQMSTFNVESFSNNAQGMDIYEDRILFQAGIEQNYIHIIDLKDSKPLGTLGFQTPTQEKCHMNNINCGIKLDASDRFPLLYLSQTSWSRACFVLRISNDAQSYSIIQTIKYVGKGHYPKNCSFDWFIDYPNNLIYTFGKYNGNADKREIMKFKLPSLEYEEVNLTDDDILDSFVLENQSIYQGSRIIDGLLFTPVGSGFGKNPGRLIIIDLGKKEVLYDILLSVGEPEAIAKYKTGVILSSGGRNPSYYFIRI